MTASSHRRVAVVNSAQTVLSPRWSDRQHIDLISDAVSRTLKGTGIRIDDVDFVIDSGSDFLDGRSISNCGFLGSMGAHHKEESRVEEDGLWALGYAANKIAGGSASVGLVIAYSKPSEGDVDTYWTSLLEPFLQRPVGLDQRSAAGLVARRYLAEAGLSADDLAVVSRRAWSRAADNPWVATAREADDEEFFGAEVASPLRAADLSRPVDGAVAVLVARADVADDIAQRPVWITGQGSAIDQHFLSARSWDALPAATAAAKAAYRMAGDTSAKDYDLFEVSASSTVGELLTVEALGLAAAHEGIDLYREDARPAVNPSGGALPADPIMATGLVRLHEAAARLGRRTGHESGRARRAVVHGTGGFAMQNHQVVTLEVDE